MIRFQQVSLMRGVKPLFDNVDVTLNPGDKIGLIDPVRASAQRIARRRRQY